MENTLYVALSNQSALRRTMDVIANNIANTSTPGFKGEAMMFAEYLTEAGKGQPLSFVQDIGTSRDFSQGKMSRTSNKHDLAIQGKGWFVLETPKGEQYTRNGRFSLDRDGQLVSSHGHPVLDRNGQKIVIDPGDTKFLVKADGTILTENGEFQLRVVEFENERTLRKISGSLYRTDAAPKDAETANVVQGTVEESNIVGVVEMSRMMDLLRQYQSSQKIIDTEHERQRRAIQSLTDQNQ